MSSVSVKRATLSSLFGLGLSLLLATQVAAASWTDPARIDGYFTYSGPYSAELVPLAGSSAVVGYGMTNGADIANVVVRRTNNSGVSWGKATVVTDHGWAPSTAGWGTNVDVAWLWNGQVYYARSDDAGRSFGRGRTLSPSDAHANRPRVARGPDGVVAVVWDQDGVVRARVSTDGGRSFAAVKTIANHGFYPVVAVGDGVVYVLYSHGDYDEVRVVRSLDNGASWGAAMTAEPYESTSYSITAEGSRAFIAYEGTSDNTYWALHYRGTSDRGTSWSRARDLLPQSWSGYNPQLSLRRGMLRAIFMPCNDYGDVCGPSGRVFYRQSSDGLRWTNAERVSPKSLYSELSGVGFAGKAIVLYTANETRFDIPVLFSRARE